MVPTNLAQSYRLGPWKPGSPPNPASGIAPRTRRSIPARPEIADPAVILMNGAYSRFSESRLVSGSSTTSFQDREIAFASATTLRPLVSVPAMEGNLPNSRAVSPNSSTRSEI
ncbi:Uncharacterised protein [Mycobacteroides abscessus subsp. abscessus]|nr:Uncharacterised protein [Mycobacteroides abscessus subsp. abscessus]